MEAEKLRSLTKTGGKFAEPEELHVVGVDRGKTSVDGEVVQAERLRNAIPTRALAEIARTWADVERGGPARADELAREAAEEHGADSAAILAMARGVLVMASGAPVEPVQVMPSDGRLVVVAGRTRTLEARAANVLLQAQGKRPLKLPISVIRQQAARAAAVENTLRRPPTWLELCELAANLDAANPGAIEGHVLDMGLRNATAFRRMAAVGRLLPQLAPYEEVLTALRSGRIKPAAAYRVAADDALAASQKAAALAGLLVAPPKPAKVPLRRQVAALVEALRGVSAMLPPEVQAALRDLDHVAPATDPEADARS